MDPILSNSLVPRQQQCSLKIMKPTTTWCTTHWHGYIYIGICLGSKCHNFLWFKPIDSNLHWCPYLEGWMTNPANLDASSSFLPYLQHAKIKWIKNEWMKTKGTLKINIQTVFCACILFCACVFFTPLVLLPRYQYFVSMIHWIPIPSTGICASACVTWLLTTQQ